MKHLKNIVKIFLRCFINFFKLSDFGLARVRTFLLYFKKLDAYKKILLGVIRYSVLGEKIEGWETGPPLKQSVSKKTQGKKILDCLFFNLKHCFNTPKKIKNNTKKNL